MTPKIPVSIILIQLVVMKRFRCLPMKRFTVMKKVPRRPPITPSTRDPSISVTGTETSANRPNLTVPAAFTFSSSPSFN